MCAIDTSEMNWLESSGRFDRYDTMEPGDGRSIWICGDCGEEGDPDEGTCDGCAEEEEEEEEEEECCDADADE